MTERQCLRNELRESLYRPLWGAKKQSPASLDGVVRCFPSETAVGPLTRPTGLSRAQQLVIFDTLKIICLPSFCQSHGGVMLDRAFPLVGTSRWWSALLTRVKAQKCLQHGGVTLLDKVKSVGAGENYCLSLRTKAQIGSRTSIEGVMETDDASHVKHLFAKQPEVMRGEMLDRWEGIGGKLEVVHKFDPFKLLVSWAFRERFHTPGSSLFLPSLLSSEIVSNDLHKPFHYRLGLHQILDVFPSAPDVAHDCNNAVYFQGGFGVDGVATLLQSPRVKKETKQDRLGQMREAKLSGLGFDRSFSDVRSKERRSATHPSLSSSGASNSSPALPSADQILEKLHGRTAAVEKSSETLSKATQDVQEGKLKGWKRRLENGLFGVGRGIRHYAFLPPAHLKIGGLAGLVASFGFHKDGLERPLLPESGPTTPSFRHWNSVRWRSAVDDHPIKSFLGCSFSAQLGRMRRRILSFTSALVQFECTVPITVGQASLPRRLQSIAASSRRNFMIGTVPLRPLLSFSFVQQVFGPVRAKVDYRVALETSIGIGSMPNLHPMNAFYRQLHAVRPCIVDAQYGFDFVVPGTQGAVKFCGWYTPYKKEAMAELRLF